MMKNRTWTALALLLIFLTPCVWAKKPVREGLAAHIEKILSDPAAVRGHWGIAVAALDGGRELYALNGDELFTPASNTKIFTTATALALAGPQYTLRTTLESTVAADGAGRLHGDLYLTGGGDAALDEAALEDLATQLAARGITRIDGDIAGDDRWLPWEPVNDSWLVGDLSWDYGAPVSALTLGDNLIFLQILPGVQPGDAAQVVETPLATLVPIDNRITTLTAGSRRALTLHRAPWSQTVQLGGVIPAGDAGETLRIAALDPAQQAAAMLASILRRHGIAIGGTARALHRGAAEVFVPDGARLVLASHLSKPLLEDVRTTNKFSQNLHAELLLRLAGKSSGGDGSLSSSLQAERAWLTTAAALDGASFALNDGSGLSRQNLASPRAFTQLLRFAATQPWGEAWRETLPQGGVDGTLARRPPQPAAPDPPAGRARRHGKTQPAPVRYEVRAKTGSFGHVNALSGYLKTETGQEAVFSILVNNHTMGGHNASQTIDQIVAAIAESLR